MALNRTKLLTNNAYSPDFPTTPRADIDGSIQEIVDLLAATTDGASGADGVGATPIPALGSANTVQAQMEAITTLGVGTLPGNNVILDSMLKQTGDNVLPRTNAHIASTANPHSTTIAQVGGSNKNILHNWDFKNPVNQRGASSYSANNYSIDRWKINDATLAINSNVGVTLTGTSAYGNLVEIIENYAEYAGKTVTFSAKILGGTGVGAGAYIDITDGVTETQSAIMSSGITTVTKTLSSSLTSLSVAIVSSNTSGKTIQIESAKLEIGSISTLANDSPADFGEQLLLCMRFYERSTSLASFVGARCIVSASTSSLCGFYFIVPKRITPTVSIYSRNGTLSKVSKLSDGLDIGTTVTARNITSLGIHDITDTGTPFTVGNSYECCYVADADL